MSTNPPTNLLEAVRYFEDLDVANDFVAELRWPDGPACPVCGGKELGYVKGRRLWQCKTKGCRKQFSVKVGTIFEDSPIPLDKWLCSLWLIANAKNGISSHELGRAIGLTQKSAWFVLHRVRLAMQTGTFERLSGEIEVDETYIGGKARFMHANERRKKIVGTGGTTANKTAVFGAFQRDGEVRAMVVPDVKKPTLDRLVREHVEPGATVYSDEAYAYKGLGDDYTHETVDHAVQYVRDQVTTNGLENFWSLLKRGLKGTYISVQPFHLFRYIDEQVYRFNRRKAVDFERFEWLTGAVAGKRLTWNALTGKA